MLILNISNHWKVLALALATLVSQTFLMPAATAQASATMQVPTATFPAGYISELSPSFHWTEVAGASSYEMQLMDDTNTAIYFSQAGIEATTFTIAGAVFDQSKVYHWRVRAKDLQGTNSAWSDVQSFLIFDSQIIPQLSSPAGYITTVSPLFSWSSVAGAVSYDLMILSEDETQVINSVVSETNSYQQPSNAPFEPYVVYHYKVRSRMPNGTTSIWSAVGSFMMFSGNDTPQLLGPAGQAPSGALNFSWRPMENVSSYEIKVMSDDEQTLYVNASTAVNGFTTSPSQISNIGKVYHWKVRSVFSSGRKSLWSDTGSFMLYDSAVVPEALIPFGYITSTRPTLEWSQVEGAASYHIEFKNKESGQIMLSESVGLVTKFDIGARLRLVQNVVYEWRVRSLLADGRTSVYSQPKSFKVSASPWEGQIQKPSISRVFYPEARLTMNWMPMALPGLDYVRYRVILRSQPAHGNWQTIWIGGPDVSAPNRVTIPSDVPVFARTTYSMIVQAFDINGVIIGQSRKVALTTPPEAPAEFAVRVQQFKDNQALELEAFKQALAARLAKQIENQEIALSSLNNKVTALGATQEAQRATLRANQAAQMSRLLESQAKALAAFDLRHSNSVALREARVASYQSQVATLQAKHEVQLQNQTNNHQAQMKAALDRIPAAEDRFEASNLKLQAHQARQLENFSRGQANKLRNFLAQLDRELKLMK